jgi:predicted nucleotidyltransferase
MAVIQAGTAADRGRPVVCDATAVAGRHVLYLPDREGTVMSIERTVLEKLRALPPRPGSVEVIPTQVERIVREFEAVQIILFGSQARGEARWDSDVDLLVVLPSVPDTHKAAVAIRRALRGIPVAKDIIVSTPDEIARYGDMVGRVLRVALREGTVLYARD